MQLTINDNSEVVTKGRHNFPSPLDEENLGP